MGFITKILTSSVTFLFAIIGGVVTGYAFLINDMEARDEKIARTMRVERTAQISELKTEIHGVKTLVQSVDNKVDILLRK